MSKTDDKKTTKNNKKAVKKVTKKDTKKKVKKVSKPQESFLTGVTKEMKKVRWPLKNEMIKYSIATLAFIMFFILFFLLANGAVSVIRELVR